MEKIARYSTDEGRAALKAATRHSLRSVVACKFALATRVDAAQLAKYGSGGEAECFMPLDILVDLQGEYDTGIPSPLLAELALQCGFALAPLDGGDDGAGIEVDDVGRQMKEGGEANVAALNAVGAACLETVRRAKRESAEARDQYAVTVRKLAAKERALMRRAG